MTYNLLKDNANQDGILYKGTLNKSVTLYLARNNQLFDNFRT